MSKRIGVDVHWELMSVAAQPFRKALMTTSAETAQFRQVVLSLSEPFRRALRQHAPACPDEPKWRAIHEAGHAAAEFLLLGTTPRKMSINRGGGAVHTAGSPRLAAALVNEEPISLDQVAPEIQSFLAGAIAESLVTDLPRWDLAQSDFEAGRMFAEYAEVDVSNCLETLAPPIVKLLAENWGLVVGLAAALVRETTLDEKSIRACIEGTKL